jgi:dTDP-4-amino-4,6-dideoxygalactose transaminase
VELSRSETNPLAAGEAGSRIPFNRAARSGNEQTNIDTAIEYGHLAADGPFTTRCNEILGKTLGSPTLLVHSCTAALEIAAILTEVGEDDEVIMPSFTFVSTANAFAIRGARPVFVEVSPETLNLDVEAVRAAIGPRTKAIVPVHYAGVGCDVEPLLALAEEHNLFLIEDAAQGLHATVAGRPLGTFGQMGALSFHETKNVTCGEGGALIVNDRALLEKAEIVREKGTDRSRFSRGQVDKYTWVDLGSSYALSELGAAFLESQLDAAAKLTAQRLEIWHAYHDAFEDLEDAGRLRRPVVPTSCTHNAHMYYLLMGDEAERDGLIRHLDSDEISAVFHYVPLHNSPGGKRYGLTPRPLEVTEDVSARLLRLPLWPEMSVTQVARVIESVRSFANSL